MFVIDVIPLSRTAPAQALSYRSSKKLTPGTIVTVPLRRKLLPAVVVESIPVREAKAELKNASFLLLKSTSKTHGRLPRAYVEAAKATALYHASTFGSVLSSLLIPILAGGEVELKITLRSNVRGANKKRGETASVVHKEAPLLSRLRDYESLVTSKTHSGTLLIVVPTEAEARTFGEYFKEFKPVVITGSISEKRRGTVFSKAYDSTRLVIVTPGFVWIPIKELAGIIIDRVSAGSYSLPKRPYIDIRVALQALARARNVSITYGDYPLPLEYRPKPDSALTGGIPKNIRVVDVRIPKGIKEERTKWHAIPEPILREIRTVHQGGGQVVVLAVRRGYAPAVVCRDCETPVTDAYGRALSLASENNARILRSADGASIESAKTLCKLCGSWNLVPLGVGSERVEEELRSAFPKGTVIRIDQDTSSAKLRTIVKVAQSEPGAILVGTELMLPWLNPFMQLELAVVASADSLLALPFWRARERLVRISLMLAERAQRLIIATRHPEDAALQTLMSAKTTAATLDDTSFWKEEVSLRKILHYPPFGTLIVFHIEGSTTLIAQMQPRILAACAPYVPQMLPPRALSPSRWRSTSVLHLTEIVWPNPALSEKLSCLPPSVRVHINSETLW